MTRLSSELISDIGKDIAIYDKELFNKSGSTLRQTACRAAGVIDKGVSEIIDSGATIVGSNCTLGSDDFIELVRVLRTIAPDTPLSLKPNAGQPELQNGVTTYKQKPEDFAQDMREILKYDGQIIGGCCGTGPTHIQLLREVIDELAGG